MLLVFHCFGYNLGNSQVSVNRTIGPTLVQTSSPQKPLGRSKPPCGGGTKVYINDPGHMTKMAAMLKNAQNPSKIFFSRTGGPIFTKLGM